jgi:hypothetical protein
MIEENVAVFSSIVPHSEAELFTFSQHMPVEIAQYPKLP